jgi:hypothetical protein
VDTRGKNDRTNWTDKSLSAEDLTGAYDAIALVQADSTLSLMDAVIGEIRRLPGVTRALPAPWIGSFERSRAPSSESEPSSTVQAA